VHVQPVFAGAVGPMSYTPLGQSTQPPRPYVPAYGPADVPYGYHVAAMPPPQVAAPYTGAPYQQVAGAAYQQTAYPPMPMVGVPGAGEGAYAPPPKQEHGPPSEFAKF
jgi:hypothetical protein